MFPLVTAWIFSVTNQSLARSFDRNTRKLNRPDHIRNLRDTSASRPHTGRVPLWDNILVPRKKTGCHNTYCYMDKLSPLCQTCSCKELNICLLSTEKERDILWDRKLLIKVFDISSCAYICSLTPTLLFVQRRLTPMKDKEYISSLFLWLPHKLRERSWPKQGCSPFTQKILKFWYLFFRSEWNVGNFLTICSFLQLAVSH